MKKLTSLLLIAVMLLTLAACGEDKSGNDAKQNTTPVAEQVDFDYAGSTAQELLNAFIKDRADIKPEEYKSIILTYANVKITEDFDLEDNITDEALDILDDEDRELPGVSGFLGELFDSPAPQVRGFAVGQIRSIFGVADTNIDRAKKLLETETDEYVLYCAINALSNEGKTDPAIGAFLIKMAGHENAQLRLRAAYALGNSWSIGVEGAVEKMIELMSDPDEKVRSAAYGYAGKLKDDRIIDPIEEMLNDPALAEYHDDGIKSLCTMWYDYPFHKNTNERAYNVTMEYIKRAPTKDTPNWIIFSYMSNVASNGYDEWKANASYFDEDEFNSIMMDVVTNPDQKFLARTTALKCVAAHSSDEVWASAKATVDGMTDSDAKLVKDSVDDAEKTRK